MGVDFNDMTLGILENPVKPGDNWPEPEPITKEDDPIPYPLAALPDGIGEAVREVLSFTQCPPALAACSALAALSLAGQGLADVRRDDGLTGPISLFFLPLAASGERKTAIDDLFMAGIRKWELMQAEAAKPELASDSQMMTLRGYLAGSFVPRILSHSQIMKRRASTSCRSGVAVLGKFLKEGKR